MNNRNAQLLFLGGAGTVTGSKLIFQYNNKKILIDCGLFQGIKELRLMNWEPLPIPSYDIDTVLITHAHLDHVGYLPSFVRDGYERKIYCTEPTQELARIILYDSAQIQEEEAEKANRDGFSKHHPAKPLYTSKDVQKCLAQFTTVPDNEWVPIDESIKFRYLKNGHILGSCSIELKYDDKTIVFSGDIGREHSQLLNAPTPMDHADYVVMESTYGNRNHPVQDIEFEFSKIINDTLHKHGNLIIPSFAVERAQELIYLINILKKKNLIPDVRVFLDSPMAIDVSEIMCRYPEWHKLSFKTCLQVFEGVTMIRDIQSTFGNIASEGSKIIIAGSGMITGGRVLEYLKAFVGDEKHTVLLVGYQAIGTRGRNLLEKQSSLKIHGNYYKVRAEIQELHGMSGHADQNELLNWLANFKTSPKKIILNHGETESSIALQKLINEKHPTSKCEIGVMQQFIELD